MELEAVNNVSVQLKGDVASIDKTMHKESERVVENVMGKTTAKGTEEDKPENEATERQISKAIEHVKSLKNMRTHCEFSYHEDIKRVSIKVVNEGTGEVVREIPPEESLEMVEKMWELAGIIVDKKI